MKAQTIKISYTPGNGNPKRKMSFESKIIIIIILIFQEGTYKAWNFIGYLKKTNYI